MRFGVNFRGRVNIKEAVKLAKEAEERGFEYILAPEYYFFRDSVTQSTAFAFATESLKVMSVFNPYTRNPALIAMTLATLLEVYGARIIPCLGATPPLWLKQMGIKQLKPLSAMTECTEVIRRLIAGEKVNAKGSLFNFEDVKLGFPLQTKCKIFFSVIGPKMLELAGCMADGVLLSAGTSIHYIKKALDLVKNSAARHGREIGDIEVAALVLYSYDNKYLHELKHFITYIVSVARLGDEVFGEKANFIRESYIQGKINDAASTLTYDDVKKVALLGTQEECIRRIEDFEEAGVDILIFVPIAEPQKAIEEAAKLISAFN